VINNKHTTGNKLGNKLFTNRAKKSQYFNGLYKYHWKIPVLPQNMEIPAIHKSQHSQQFAQNCPFFMDLCQQWVKAGACSMADQIIPITSCWHAITSHYSVPNING